MAQGVNKVILIGNLGNDPEVRHTTSGGVVVNVSLATSHSWTDKQTGLKNEQTEWHRVVFFGKLAEIAQQYLRKGGKVYIEGYLKTEKWTDNHGQDRYTTKIVANAMRMLDSRSEGGAAPQTTTQQPEQSGQASTGMIDDDIPF